MALFTRPGHYCVRDSYYRKFFVLFGSLGISLYGQRQIAFLQTKPKRRTRVLFETLLLKGFTLAIAIGLFVWLFAFKGEYAKYYRILLLYIVANILDISYFFQGMEEFKMIVKRNFVVNTKEINKLIEQENILKIKDKIQ